MPLVVYHYLCYEKLFSAVFVWKPFYRRNIKRVQAGLVPSLKHVKVTVTYDGCTAAVVN